MNEKSTAYRMFHLFGLRIYITRRPLKLRQRGKKRKDVYRQRMEQIGHACEVCGAPLTIYGNILHTLPKGHPDRNTIGDMRILCAECYNRIQREISLRCYDNTVPAYSKIVSQVLADATIEKGGEL